jgi:transcription initiation factor TFIIIB Brf1 subunit/transcription initiation factor TFIIB
MNVQCQTCRNPSLVITDYDSGNVICTGCGLILDTNVHDTVSVPVIDDDILGSFIADSTTNLIEKKTRHLSRLHTSTSRLMSTSMRESKIRERINGVCHLVIIPLNVRDSAIKYALAYCAMKPSKVKTLCTDTVYVASIFLAFVANRLYIPIRVINGFRKIARRTINKKIKTMSRLLGIKMPNKNTLIEYAIRRICIVLNVEPMIEPTIRTYNKLNRDGVQVCKTYTIPTVCATIVYAVLKTTQNDVTQKMLIRHMGISESVISKLMSLINSTYA